MSNKKDIQRALKAFGDNLRRERTSRNITQEKLAELADLNIRTVQKIEAGQTNILITTMLRLKDGVGCKLNDLFGG